ncbi:MAG: DNA polymerase III subunit alpha [Deltaproteobacteria bacterium]|nr:DNA polymerase III subunit alpha [Deltaproteobacteria bacterium]
MIPLVTRSNGSLGWGVAAPEAIVRAAFKYGYRRMALTDTDNLYNLWPFLQACSEVGISPIIGAELTEPDSKQRVVCLVENELGYRNLCRLISKRHCQKDFKLIKDLPSLALGLYVLVPSAKLLASLYEAGVTVAAALPRNPSPQAVRARVLARNLGVDAVAVPSSFFVYPQEYNLHRLLRAIANNTSFSCLLPNEVAPADAFLASPAEYEQRFAIWPEVMRASEEIAERLNYTAPNFGIVMPPLIEQSDLSTSDGNSHELLRALTYQGAEQRYGAELHETVVERIEYELNIICSMGFASYFLVVEQIVKRSSRICGRGSGAASIVAYCLGITNVCPIKFNLYFERFLNPGRCDPPDIDVDFAWDERDTAINTVLTEHRGHCAMVASFTSFQPRMAIRETAKVFGLTDGEIGQVSKRLPWFWHEVEDDDSASLLQRLRKLPELKDLDFAEPWPQIMQLAQQLIGIPRHISVHPGGIVITPEPIDNYVPIEMAPKGVPIIQWEKDGAETAGLVKIDLLGNRSLAVIRDAIANIRLHGDFAEQDWEPEDDLATQDCIAKGQTMGCFYIESPATRLLQQKAKRGDYEHVVIHSSVIRPAANKWIHEYLRRLHGGQWQPIHPLLEHVLDDTYGIMVYQEDVAKAAKALAGFSHVEADALRKVMSKRDRAKRLPDFFKRFVAGARARGVSNEKIASVWEMILSFDGYSFCKPHSASYARVSFQAAYLKTHFPAEFMAAVISNQGGFYSLAAYVSEAKRLGIKILPPDINHSEMCWQGKDGTMRPGWLTLRGLSIKTSERIIARRPYKSFIDFLERVRPEEPEARLLIHARAFDSLVVDEATNTSSRRVVGEEYGNVIPRTLSVVKYTQPYRRHTANAIASHAALLWQLAAWRDATSKKNESDLFAIDSAAKARREDNNTVIPAQAGMKSAMQSNLMMDSRFRGSDDDIPPPPLLPDDPRDLLHAEMTALGFLCAQHPLILCDVSRLAKKITKAQELSHYTGKRVCGVGFLITGKVVATNKGDPMEFVTFEDDTGLMECTFFPRVYRRFCHMLDYQHPYIIEGKVDEDYGAHTITVDKIKRMELK